MKLSLLLFLVISTIAFAQESSTSKVPEVPGWFLTWHDEFDGDKVDLSKWTPDNRNLHKNQEMQHYRPDDVILDKGILRLRAQKREFEGQPYTSGLVDTRGKFYQAYGRFETRIKVPKGKGLWPAFWLLPEDSSWPPEIDILEFIGHIPNVANFALHVRGPSGTVSQHKDSFGPFLPKDFHVFGAEWEPGELRFYVDGKVKYTIKEHVPSDSMFIILNLAVGGEWPGPPDASTPFPSYTDIDYVRVWAKDTPGSCVLSAWGEHGRVAVDPPRERLKPGEKITLLARPDYGYKFDHWSGALSGNANPMQGEIKSNMKVTAHFVPDPASIERSKSSLSRNKPSESSSDESSLLSSPNAFDGNLATRWSSQHRDPQWLLVDLGKSYRIDSVRLIWQDPAGEYFIHSFGTDYSIEVSEDNKSWKTVYSTKNGNGGTEELDNLNATGRYIRYTGNARHTNRGHTLLEFEVFGR
jgi:beta-glucanase (GH16 family)